MWQLACIIPATLSGHLHPPVKRKRIAIQAAASSTMPGLLSPRVQEFSPRPASSPCLPAQSRTTPCSSSPPITPGSPPSRRLTTSQCHQLGDRGDLPVPGAPGAFSAGHTHGVHSCHHRFRAPGEEGKTQEWDEEVLSTFERAVADPHREAAAGRLVCPPCHVPPAPASPC